MTNVVKIAAVAAALLVSIAGAQAQQRQGSNEAKGYAQSHHAFGGAYAYAGPRHHRYWR